MSLTAFNLKPNSKMQSFKSFMFTLLCFAAISSTHSIIPVRRIHSSRHHDTAVLNEKHYHNLLQIANKDAISILDTDFMNYRPPYLNEFCGEIGSLIEDGVEYQSEEVLAAIAAKFKETVYTEINFPHTYRLDAQVRVNNDELLEYRRRHCDYQTKEDMRRTTVRGCMFGVVMLLVFLVFNV